MTDLARRYHVGTTSVLRRCALVAATVFSFVILQFTGDRSALADDYVEHQTNAALSAFYGFCLTEHFDAYSASDLAEKAGWKEIPKDEIGPFIPVNEAEYDFFDGYLLVSPDEPPVPMAVFVGAERVSDRFIQHCSFYFRHVLVEEFKRAFVEDTDAQLVSDESRIGAVNEFFLISDFPKSLVLFESQKRNPRGLRATFIVGAVGEN